MRAKVRRIYRRISWQRVSAKVKRVRPKNLRADLNRRILEQAIKNAKTTLAQQGINLSELNENQREIIVHSEVQKIHKQIKRGGLSAILIPFGISTL
ncbi:MAG: hypothetical protein ACPGGG_03770 [Parvibaculales bacterium]